MTEAAFSEEFLTVEAVASRLGGRAVRTLANWRASRTGPPFVRAGRTVLYRRSSFEAWLISQERPCGPATSAKAGRVVGCRAGGQ